MNIGMDPRKFMDKLVPRKREFSPYARLSDRFFAASMDLLLMMYFIIMATQFAVEIVYPEGNAYIAAEKYVIEKHPDVKTDAEMYELVIKEHPDLMALRIEQFMFECFVAYIVLGLYYIPFTYRRGATLGKMLIGIKVVDVTTEGKLTLSQTIIRYFCYLVSAFPALIGFFWVGFNKYKRGWHDYFADTLVIYDPNRWYKKYIERAKAWLFGSKK